MFDPKLPPRRSSLDQAKGPFREALVFVIGGGNYLEREVSDGWQREREGLGRGSRGKLSAGASS